MLYDNNFLLNAEIRGYLDRACERGITNFLNESGHNADDTEHKRRASRALADLRDAVNTGANLQVYNSHYGAASYLVEHHLQHCVLAYWSFRVLFDVLEEFPNSLYVLDLGAGTGAGRIGLALALLAHQEVALETNFQAVELSNSMIDAGNYFWREFEREIGVEFNINSEIFQALPGELPVLPDETLRVTTAFHLTLPYDWQSFGKIGEASEQLIQGAMQMALPDFGLFTCHERKREHLVRCIRNETTWDHEYNRQFQIPEGHGRIAALTFAMESGFFQQVYDRTPWRYDLPRGILLIRQLRAGVHRGIQELEDQNQADCLLSRQQSEIELAMEDIGNLSLRDQSLQEIAANHDLSIWVVLKRLEDSIETESAIEWHHLLPDCQRKEDIEVVFELLFEQAEIHNVTLKFIRDILEELTEDHYSYQEIRLVRLLYRERELARDKGSDK